ncbi:thioredoxin family protein [Chitinophaga agrisoli]|nr:thioredoxin fold domain-containing protein [Chitinophaga agrisoli]
MKLLIFVLLTLLPGIVYSNYKVGPAYKVTGRGVSFEKQLNWQQIKERARAENKYIFVDAYTTWCGPCRAMDREVYPNEKVGNSLNSKFISVKVQMDTSKIDDSRVKFWYDDARAIMKEFSISAFPTFLFFSPDGKIVHRAIGYKNIDDFIALAEDATNPQRQYYTLLNEYNEGKRDYKVANYLMNIATGIGEKDQVDSIARDYLVNYLETMSDDKLYTRETIQFLASYPKLVTSKSKLFSLLYHRQGDIDTMVHSKGFAHSMVKYIVSKEDIYPKLWKDPEHWTKSEPISDRPDWKKMTDVIRTKYDAELADEVILDSQVIWYYNYRKDWRMAAQYFIKRNERYGFAKTGMGALDVNEAIWYIIFVNSDDKDVIDKGIVYARSIVDALEKEGLKGFNMASVIDTYANLLYKAGRTKEAIEWEEKAVQLSVDDKDPDRVREFQEIIGKMKATVPTWR